MLVYNVYGMYFLSRVEKWKFSHPAELQTLVKKLSVVIISQLLSFVPFAISTFVPPSAMSKYLVECLDV